jgi:nitrite reductase/ring-hydroxylating ferredoxin subunit
MGVKLEKMLFGMWSPHKVKLAVSGCPRNCAESGIKDIGVIGVDSGYEIYVAGNGGIKTEVAQFLCKVKTDDEVLEYSGAFLQLYREEAFYLERTVSLRRPRRPRPCRRRRWSPTRSEAQGAVRTPALRPCKDYEDPWQEAVEETRGAPRVSGHRNQGSGGGVGMSDWIRVCALDEIAPQGSRVVASSQGDIAIFRTASRSRCSACTTSARTRAAPCRRAWCMANAVTCPLHGFKIGLKDGEALAPDKGCTKTFAVRLDGGEVWLQLK